MRCGSSLHQERELTMHGHWEPHGIAPQASKGKPTFICTAEVNSQFGGTTGCGARFAHGDCPKKHLHLSRPLAFSLRAGAAYGKSPLDFYVHGVRRRSYAN